MPDIADQLFDEAIAPRAGSKPKPVLDQQELDRLFTEALGLEVLDTGMGGTADPLSGTVPPVTPPGRLPPLRYDQNSPFGIEGAAPAVPGPSPLQQTVANFVQMMRQGQEPPDRSIPGEFAAGVGRGFARLPSQAMGATAAAVNLFGPSKFGAKLAEMAQTASVLTEASNEIAMPRSSDAGSWTARAIVGELGESAPQLGLAVGTALAAAPLGLPAQVAIFAGTSAAPVVGSVFQDAMNATGDPVRAAREAGLAGTVTLVTSYFPGAAILQRTPFGSALLRRVSQTMIGRVGLAATAEGLQEGVEQYAQELIAEMMRNDQTLTVQTALRILTDPERAERYAKAAVVGALAGGAAHVPIEAKGVIRPTRSVPSESLRTRRRLDGTPQPQSPAAQAVPADDGTGTGLDAGDVPRAVVDRGPGDGDQPSGPAADRASVDDDQRPIELADIDEEVGAVLDERNPRLQAKRRRQEGRKLVLDTADMFGGRVPESVVPALERMLAERYGFRPGVIRRLLEGRTQAERVPPETQGGDEVVPDQEQVVETAPLRLPPEIPTTPAPRRALKAQLGQGLGITLDLPEVLEYPDALRQGWQMRQFGMEKVGYSDAYQLVAALNRADPNWRYAVVGPFGDGQYTVAERPKTAAALTFRPRQGDTDEAQRPQQQEDRSRPPSLEEPPAGEERGAAVDGDQEELLRPTRDETSPGPADGETPGPGEAFTPRNADEAILHDALDHTVGRDEKIAALVQNGATDDDIRAFLDRQWGLGGGRPGPAGMGIVGVDVKGGRTPRVTIRMKDGTARTLAGKQIIDAVRSMYGIGQPGEPTQPSTGKPDPKPPARPEPSSRPEQPAPQPPAPEPSTPPQPPARPQRRAPEPSALQRLEVPTTVSDEDSPLAEWLERELIWLVQSFDDADRAKQSLDPNTPEYAAAENSIPELRQRIQRSVDEYTEMFGDEAAKALRYGVQVIRTGRGTWPPKDLDPPGPADDPVIVEWIANKLRAGKPWDGIVQARADIGQRFDIDVKPGTPEAKRVDELIERGVVLEARRLIQIGRDAGTSSAGIFDALVKLYKLQPSLNVRTSTSMLQQAYSTPVPLAFVASELAGIGPGVSVYEPTAGNGMLLIGADVNTTQANELNDARADALEAAGFKTTRNDATKYVPGKELFDVVIENPPFGTVKDENANKTVWHDAPLIGRTPNIDHAIVLRSLEALKPDGRAVLIVGGKIGDEQRRSVAYRGREVSSFYFHLYNNYNVIDHFTVSGDLYKKQGAGFPVDVIVIEGRKKSARQLPAVDVPRVIETWEALGKVLNDRPNPTGVVSRTGHSQSQAPGAGNRPEPGGDRTDDADGGSRILRPRNRPHGGAGGAKPRAGVSRGQSDRQSQPDVQRDVGSQGTGVDGPAPVPAPSGPPEVPPATKPVSAEPPPAPPADGDNAPRLDRTPVANRANVADENLLQVTYTPGAKQAPALGTLTPRNMAAPIEKAIERLMARSKAKSLEDFVATQLGWPMDRVLSSFSAEQVDALALAIDNSMRGKALVLGDQTGMGKGRVVGAMLLWAEKQGFVPVFVTERPNLYADILRDLDDIGARGYQLLPTNSDLTGKNAVPLPNGGTLESLPNPAVAMREAFENHRADNGLVAVVKDKPRRFNAIATTYSQLQGIGSDSPLRRELLLENAHRSFFVFDESHNAGGSPQTEWQIQGKAENRADFIRRIIGRAGGVMYSSATYAKRPESMDLYRATDMKLAVKDITKLGETIKRGGVAMQQMVAEMLTRAGQYIRRERSFNGIKFTPRIVPVDRKAATVLSDIFAGVAHFDRLKYEAMAKVRTKWAAEAATLGYDTSIGRPSVESTNFTSIMHNLVDQFLLATKIDASMAEIRKALANNQKVVIALSNTMERALEDAREAQGANVGDPATLSFRNLLRRYLYRSREVLKRPPRGVRGETIRHYLTDEELGPHALRHFNKVLQMIEKAPLGDIPMSPIDRLKFLIGQLDVTDPNTGKVRKAVVGEITGRRLILDYSKPIPTYEQRDESDVQAAGRVRAISAFQNGQMDVIILNQAGSTGLSLHADAKRARDKRVRHMLILQPDRNIDTFMQMLGRINRTGQVVLPEYSLVMSDLPSEKRPAAVLTKKLASLNANTTAEREGAVDLDIPDVMNKVGDEVVKDMMKAAPDLYRELDEPNLDPDQNDAGKVVASVTGRLAVLSPERQEQFWKDLEEAFVLRVQELDRQGNNPLKASRVDLKARTIEKIQVLPRKSADPSPFTEPVYAERMSVEIADSNMNAAAVKAAVQSALGGKTRTQWIQDTLDETRKAVADKYKAKYGDLDDDENSELAKRLDKMFSAVSEFVHRFPPGTQVKVETAGRKFVGVVIDLKRRNSETSSPSAPSTWNITIAVPDEVGFLKFPLSKAMKEEGDYGYKLDDFGGDVGALQEAGFEGAKSVFDAFDINASNPRKDRWMLTGNLLAAGEYARYNGQPMFYTTADGGEGAGVLMPWWWNPADWDKMRPRHFTTGESVATFVRRGGQISSSDDALDIFRLGDDDVVVFEAPKSKQEGGKYVLNRNATKAAKAEFVSAGNRMRLTVDGHRAAAVAQAYLDAGVTLRMVVPNNTDLHEQWLALHDQLEGVANGTPGEGAPGATPVPGSGDTRSPLDDPPGTPANMMAQSMAISLGLSRLMPPAGFGDMLRHAIRTIRGLWGEVAAKTAPRTTLANRTAGEAVAEYIGSKVWAQYAAEDLAGRVLGDRASARFANLLGAVLTEDRLRGLRAAFIAAGDMKEADAVTTLVGQPGSPFPNEQAYQKALMDKDIIEAVERYRKFAVPMFEELYRQANEMDPMDPMPNAVGEHFKVYSHLLAIREGEKARGRVGLPTRGNLRNPLKKRPVTSLKAYGTGRQYATNIIDIMAATIEKQATIAAQKKMYRVLVRAGLAKIARPGQEILIGGRRAWSLPIQFRRRPLLLNREDLVDPTEEPRMRTVNQDRHIYIRSDIYPEIRRALEVDYAGGDLLTNLSEVPNAFALLGPIDAFWHTFNLALNLATRPFATGSKMSEAFMAMGGIPMMAGTLFTLVRGTVRAALNRGPTRTKAAELARIAAMRQKYTSEGLLGKAGDVLNMGWWLSKVDPGVRLMMNDGFDTLVRLGLVENTATARREFVNQVGQYISGAQPLVRGLFKSLGFSRFVVAGTSIRNLSFRSLIGSAGVKAAGNTRAERLAKGTLLRTLVWSRIVGTILQAGLLSLLFGLLRDREDARFGGRQGVPYGAIDLYINDPAGRPLYWDILAATQMRRILRIGGIDALVKGLMSGQRWSDIVDKMIEDAINSGVLHPLAGPPLQVASVAITGRTITGHKEAKIAPPGRSQMLENVKAAGRQLLGQVGVLFGIGDETVRNRVLGNFAVKSGRTEKQQQTLAERIDFARLGEWIDDVADRIKREFPPITKDPRETEADFRAKVEARTKAVREMMERELADVPEELRAYARRALILKKRIFANGR